MWGERGEGREREEQSAEEEGKEESSREARVESDRYSYARGKLFAPQLQKQVPPQPTPPPGGTCFSFFFFN
jgi:hypothetical protein